MQGKRSYDDILNSLAEQVRSRKEEEQALEEYKSDLAGAESFEFFMNRKLRSKLEQYLRQDASHETESLHIFQPEDELRLCPSCHKPLSANARFCPNCGTASKKKKAYTTNCTEAQIRCPGCGAVISQGAKFCSTCGSPAKNMEIPVQPSSCPSCGRTINPAARFCGGCGLMLKS